MKLNELTIAQASSGLQKKEFSSVELTKACFDEIKKTDKKIEAFLTLTEDSALAQAKEADQRADFSKPLTGIPYAAKDIFCTKGVRTTCSSKILENYIPPYSATVIEKIQEQSGVMLGKVNMDEFACGSSTETSYFAKTKNPWDLGGVRSFCYTRRYQRDLKSSHRSRLARRQLQSATYRPCLGNSLRAVDIKRPASMVDSRFSTCVSKTNRIVTIFGTKHHGTSCV